MTVPQPYFSNIGPTCPYCEFGETPDEPFFFNEGGFDLDCGECGKKFIVQPNCSWTWVTRPIAERADYDNSEVA